MWIQHVGWKGVTSHCLTAVNRDSLIALYENEKESFIFILAQEYCKKYNKNILILTVSEDTNYDKVKLASSNFRYERCEKRSLKENPCLSWISDRIATLAVPRCTDFVDGRPCLFFPDQNFGLVLIDCMCKDLELVKIITDSVLDIITSNVKGWTEPKFCFLFEVVQMTEGIASSSLQALLLKMKDTFYHLCPRRIVYPSSSFPLHSVNYSINICQKLTFESNPLGKLHILIQRMQSMVENIKESDTPFHTNIGVTLSDVLTFYGCHGVIYAITYFMDELHKRVDRDCFEVEPILFQYFESQMLFLKCIGENILKTMPSTVFQFFSYLEDTLAKHLHTHNKNGLRNECHDNSSRQTSSLKGSVDGSQPCSPPSCSNSHVSSTDDHKLSSVLLKCQGQRALLREGVAQNKSFLIVVSSQHEGEILKPTIYGFIKSTFVEYIGVFTDTQHILNGYNSHRIFISTLDIAKKTFIKFDALLVLQTDLTHNVLRVFKLLTRTFGDISFFVPENKASFIKEVEQYKLFESRLRTFGLDTTFELDNMGGDFCNGNPWKELERLNSQLSHILYNYVGASLYTKAEECDDSSVVKYVTSLYLSRETFIEEPVSFTITCNCPAICGSREHHVLYSRMAAAEKACKQLRDFHLMDDNYQSTLRMGYTYGLEREDTKFLKLLRAKHLSDRVSATMKLPSMLQDRFTPSKTTYPLYCVQLRRVRLFSRTEQQEDYVQNQSDGIGFYTVNPLPKEWMGLVYYRFLYKNEQSGPTICFALREISDMTMIPEFTLYDRIGELAVTITEVPSAVDTFRYTVLMSFNQYLVAHVFQGAVDWAEDTEFRILVTLLKYRTDSKHPTVNYEALFEIQNQIGDWLDPKVPLPINPGDLTSLDDAVIVPLHVSRGILYYFTAVCPTITCESPFPDLEKAPSYSRYYQQRYGISLNPQLPMLLVRPSNSRLNFLTPRYENRAHDSEEIARYKKIYLPVELCGVHPIKLHLWLRLILIPCIFYRLLNFSLFHDFRNLIDMHLVTEQEEIQEPPLIRSHVLNHAHGIEGLLATPAENEVSRELCSSGYADLCSLPDHVECHRCAAYCFVNLSSALAKSLLKRQSTPPPLSFFAIALTAAEANEEISNDRLEFLGDSTLNFLITLELFHHHRYGNQGILATERSKQVSNYHLGERGYQVSLESCIVTEEFDFRKFLLRYLMLCKTSGERGEINRSKKDLDKANEKLSREVSSKMRSTVISSKAEWYDIGNTFPNSNVKLEKVIRAKSVADTVEALLGLYFYHCGWDKMPELLATFGFKTCCIKTDTTYTFHCSNSYCEVCCSEDTYSLTRSVPLNTFLDQIGYKCRYHCLFNEAFTTSCYPLEFDVASYNNKRLEFLGDSLLSLLVTLYLMNIGRNLSSGHLTSVRSAIVDSRTFATLATLNKFHCCLKFASSRLYSSILTWTQYIEQCEGKPWDQRFSSAAVIFDDAEDINIEVPKVMANVFESVAGAIFLDSGQSLWSVWKVYGPMLKPALEYYIANPPRSPVQLLNEMPGLNASYRELEKRPDGKHCYEVHVTGVGTFYGTGFSRKAAKAIAARQALMAVEQSLK